jgi:hypothetical protein
VPACRLRPMASVSMWSPVFKDWYSRRTLGSLEKTSMIVNNFSGRIRRSESETPEGRNSASSSVLQTWLLTVITALPGQAKRAAARSVADRDDGKGDKGAVRGDLAVDRVIVGIWRDARSARASRMVEASPMFLEFCGLRDRILWSTIRYGRRPETMRMVGGSQYGRQSSHLPQTILCERHDRSHFKVTISENRVKRVTRRDCLCSTLSPS